MIKYIYLLNNVNAYFSAVKCYIFIDKLSILKLFIFLFFYSLIQKDKKIISK